MAMSDGELNLLIEKLKQKYTEYSRKNPTWKRKWNTWKTGCW